MNKIESTIDEQEVNKFAKHAKDWWDTEGPLKTLHDINQVRLEFIANHSDLKNSRVLDVGCGGGILSEAMARVGAIVTGIDVESEAIQVAQEHARDNKLTINYQCLPIEELDEKKFDVITCMEMLEHVSHPEVVIKHCKRLLKPNGVLFLSTINRTLKAYVSAILAAEYILNILPRQTHDYNKFIKPCELMNSARKFNLDLIEMKGMNYNPILRHADLSSNISVNYLLALRS